MLCQHSEIQINIVDINLNIKNVFVETALY